MNVGFLLCAPKVAFYAFLRTKRRETKNIGKHPQKRVDLPEGWWPRLVGLCNSLWNQDGERLDIYNFTKISKRTFDKAKQTNQVTEAIFIRLMSELGFDSSDALLDRLRPTSEAAPILVESDEPIHEEVQEKLDKADELYSADKYGEAIPYLESALGVADRLRHVPSQVKCRTKLARAQYEANENFTGAEKNYRDALELLPKSESKLRGNVLHGLGDMLLNTGRINEARATIETALDCYQSSGVQSDQAGVLISLGMINNEAGYSDKAMQLIDESIQILLKGRISIDDSKKLSENAHLLGVAHLNKALICRSTKSTNEAISLLEKAQDWHSKSGDRVNSVKALIWKGELHCSNADYEDGFECFVGALEEATDIDNSLWRARSLEKIAKLYASHTKWETALQAMLAAATGAEEADNPDAQVQYLCLSAKLLREWKEYSARREFSKKSHDAIRQSPAEQRNELAAQITAAVSAISKTIPSLVRDDGEIFDLLSRAKEIAEQNELFQPLANCILDEAFNIVPEDDEERRTELVRESILLLEKELSIAESPKRRGHLMGRLSSLNGDIGEKDAALRWLHQAGEIFEETGNAFGLANYHGSLAETYRANRNLDGEITSYKTVLSLVAGRNYPDIAAGTRINLAATLRLKGEFDEALGLLDEAEQICDKHNIRDFISAIAGNRSAIEDEIQNSQLPTATMQEILDSLQELLEYRPELANGYLAFWYFAFQTEITRLLKSGPKLSLMVIENDVGNFLKFTEKFGHLADHFFMATSTPPIVDMKPKVLPIPPTWLFPPNFVLVLTKRPENSSEDDYYDREYDELPDITFSGPAKTLPPFMMVDEKSDVDGEGHVMPLAPMSLPPEMIELMLKHPTEELNEKRAMWLPVNRFSSKDQFLTDLRISRERGLVPVYFGQLPSSDRVVVCAATDLRLQLKHDGSGSVQNKWKNSLIKLSKLGKEDAEVFLADLSILFPVGGHQNSVTNVKICLLEYPYMENQVVYPAILVESD